MAHTRYIGNAGRNVLIGPGLAQVNVVVAKRIRLLENVNLQFRSELHNLFNRANFSSPSAAIWDATSFKERLSVGQIQSTAGVSRQLQLALKIEF